MIVSFVSRFNSPLDGRKILILMIKSFLPTFNNLPNTFEKVIKTVKFTRILKDQIYYCKKCQSQLTEDFKCCKRKCENQYLILNEYDSMCLVSIKSQLESLIITYFDEIQNYILNDRNYIDLTDGLNYKNESLKQENKVFFNLMLF